MSFVKAPHVKDAPHAVPRMKVKPSQDQRQGLELQRIVANQVPGSWQTFMAGKDVWEAHQHPDDPATWYYYCRRAEVSTLDRPVLDPGKVPFPWLCLEHPNHEDGEDHNYYYNPTTDVSTMDRPTTPGPRSTD
jgi:hypothetical protein